MKTFLASCLGIFNRALIVLTVILTGCAAGSVPSAQIAAQTPATTQPTTPTPPVTPSQPSQPASTTPDFTMSIANVPCSQQGGGVCQPGTFYVAVTLTPTDPRWGGAVYVEWSALPAGVGGGTQQSNSYVDFLGGSQAPSQTPWFGFTLNANAVPGTYPITFTATEVSSGEPVSGKTPVTQTVDLVISNASSAIWQAE